MTEIQSKNQISVSCSSHENVHLPNSNGSSSSDSTEGNTFGAFLIFSEIRFIRFQAHLLNLLKEKFYLNKGLVLI